MTELTVMESSFSCNHHSCFIFFFPRQNKGTSQLLMHSSQQPVMFRKAGILAMSLHPWKWSHSWVSSNFSKESQKSIITSILLTSLWPHWSHPEPKPQFRKGEHKSFRNPNALFQCWWQITPCAVRHEIFYDWKQILVGILQKHERQGATLDAVLSSVRHYMLLPNGWRYWSCYFNLDTARSS